MVLDILLMLLGLILVLVGTIQRFVRSVLMVVSVYFATVSALLMYHLLSPWVGDVIGKKQNLRDSVAFLLIFYLIFFIVFAMLYKAFPDTRLMKLKFFDFVLGFMVAVFAVAVLSGITINAFDVMIKDSWRPMGMYQLVFGMSASSNLRGLVAPLMRYYAYLFYPLYWGNYPEFLLRP